MRIALVGLGLIGGSIARALRSTAGPAHHAVVAWTPREGGPRAALASGVIDEVAPDLASAVRGADLVILAAPPVATLGLLETLAGLAPRHLSTTTVTTDVTSTKGAIMNRAAALRLRFVGGHPMAGRELSGFEAASAELFLGRPWIVVATADADPRDVSAVEDLARGCGAIPTRMDAATHDALTAAISHAPLVTAVALLEAVAGPPGTPPRDDWDAARRLAATGWRDATRLARGDPEMGAGILATNAPAVAARLRAVADRLDAWIRELEAPGGPDAERLASLLAADRVRALEALLPVGGGQGPDGAGRPATEPESEPRR